MWETRSVRDSLGLRVAALPLWLPGPAETGLERGWRGGFESIPPLPPPQPPADLALKEERFFCLFI